MVKNYILCCSDIDMDCIGCGKCKGKISLPVKKERRISVAFLKSNVVVIPLHEKKNVEALLGK